jgi:hypothetical protein
LGQKSYSRFTTLGSTTVPSGSMTTKNNSCIGPFTASEEDTSQNGSGWEEAGRSPFALLSLIVFRYCSPDYFTPDLRECFNSSRFEVDAPTANSASSLFLLAL